MTSFDDEVELTDVPRSPTYPPSASTSISTAYHHEEPLNDSEDAPLQDDVGDPCKHPQRQHRPFIWHAAISLWYSAAHLLSRSISRTLMIQGLAFLWLIPIIALLVLNGQTYVIGASANCLGILGGCLPYVYTNDSSIDSMERPAALNKRTHDLLGGLQLISKAMEIYFIAIATCLVYMCSLFLATGDGLPLGYFSVSSDFINPLNLFGCQFWSTVRRIPGSHTGLRRKRIRLYLFVGATVFLCGVCNLMGPAIAVLLIPTLQWLPTKPFGNSTFAMMASDSPPNATRAYLLNDSSAARPSECLAEDFRALKYRCASNWAVSLDGLANSYLATQYAENALSVQGEISFSYNTSAISSTADTDAMQDWEVVTFMPSRWTLAELDYDMQIVRKLSAGQNLSEVMVTRPLSEYYVYNNTVQTELRRHGPIVGALTNFWSDLNDAKSLTIEVASDRQVRCYKSYNSANAPLCWRGECGHQNSGNYTRCIPTGYGWNDGYETRNFTVLGRFDEVNNRTQPVLVFTIHSTRKAAFLLDGELPIDIQNFTAECLTPKPATGCDWQAFFNYPVDRRIFNRTQDVTTWEIVSKNAPNDEHPTSISLVLDFVAFQTFADYTLDPSYLTNPAYSVDYALSLPKSATLADLTKIRIDPAWTLAAWAVDDGGIVESSQSVGVLLQNVFDNMWIYNDRDPLSTEYARATGGALMPVLQMLSILDYDVEETSDPTTVDETLRLQSSGRVQVYAYGFSSRTSWFGLAITSIGCVIVIIEVICGLIFGLWCRRSFRSSTDLLAAALQHSYNGEFAGVVKEKYLSRVELKLKEDNNVIGKFRYKQV